MSKTGIFSRRGFFARVFGLLGAVGLAGCGRARPGIDVDTLEAVLDTLIPADEDPGALEAGVPAAIARRIESDPVSAKRYRRLLEWASGRAREAHRRRFAALPLQQRDHLLKELYRSRGSGLAQVRIDLNVVVEQCFHEFYSSPAADKVIGYHPPIEGGYPDYHAPPPAMT